MIILENSNNTPKLQNIDKLTALWALSESGLGGILHAYRIPFSGFFLAAFAIIIIRYIAFLAENPFKSIINATILVLVVKIIASPQSPITAYLAVSFQGVMGAIIYKFINRHHLGSYVHSSLSFIETAIQKLLVVWILFGSSFFVAFDKFSADVLESISISVKSISNYIIVIYLTIYFIWAMYIAYLSNTLPKKVYERHLELKRLDVDIYKTPMIPTNTSKGFFKKYLPLVVLTILIALAMIFKSQLLINTLIRTLVVILVWVIITPILKKLLFIYLSKERNKYSNGVSNIIKMLPLLKNNIGPAYTYAKIKHNGLSVYKEFLFNFVAISIYGK